MKKENKKMESKSYSIEVIGIDGESTVEEFVPGINEITGENLVELMKKVGAKTSEELGFYYLGTERFIDEKIYTDKNGEDTIILWV
jgi:hypothetical protein